MSGRVGLLAALALLCAGCSAEPTATAQVDAPAPKRPEKPRFDPAAIAAMKKQLLAEPKVKDLHYEGQRGSVTWTIGVLADGSARIGYADYVCTLLSEKGLVDRATDVRVVDVVQAQSNGDFRAASLGHADCSTGNDLGT